MRPTLGWAIGLLALLLVACPRDMRKPGAASAGGTVTQAPVGTLEGHVTIGPLRPVQRLDAPPPSVPPEAYAARPIQVFREDGTTLVASVTISPDGTYRASLAPGTYVVDIFRRGRFERAAGLPKTVTIERGRTLRLDIDIDTGMR